MNYDVENVQVSLNNNYLYPKDRLNVKVVENKCGNIYEMFKTFRKSYYNLSDEEDTICDYITFCNNYPIIAIDCSHQPDVIKESLINTKLYLNFRTGFPANGRVHLVMIMDRKVVYNPLSNQVIP